LLDNRPDVKQAEMGLVAAKLDVKVAKARFILLRYTELSSGF
jgi:outer membrane protein TolC